MNNCRIWSQALRLIKTRAADLVAALDNMTMAQLNFKVGIALKSKDPYHVFSIRIKKSSN